MLSRRFSVFLACFLFSAGSLWALMSQTQRESIQLDTQGVIGVDMPAGTGTDIGLERQELSPLNRGLQDYIIGKGIILSREYSFKWNKTSIVPRTRSTQRVFDLIKEIGDLHFIEDGKENTEGLVSVRMEYGLQGFRKTCGLSDVLSLRVREYLRGYREGYLTLDVKGNYAHKENQPQSRSRIQDLADLPLSTQPGVTLIIDKLEEDYHICDSKFSRESRVLLPIDASLQTCDEVLELFPGIKASHREEATTRTPTSLWWVWKHYGVTPFVTSEGKHVEVEIESTFTLQYVSLQASQADFLMQSATGDMILPTSKSEWSLRIYSGDHGHQIWEEEIVRAFDTKFQRIVKELTARYFIIPDDRYCKEM